MARKIRKTSSTGIYHVMPCGINRQRLFEEPADYSKFLDCLGIVGRRQVINCPQQDYGALDPFA
jgi:hypothetical protein